MALKKVTQEDTLIKIIDDMIKDLELRRADIIARRPQTDPQPDFEPYIDVEGKVWTIKKERRKIV